MVAVGHRRNVRAEMRADPPVRTDGLCATPGCGKRLISGPPKTMPKALRALFVAELAREPYCSTRCCREWHGNHDRTEPTADPSLIRTAPRKFYGTPERRAYREKHKVPCEDGCGKLVEGRGRARHPDPDRPYLCHACALNRRRKVAV